jgi:hypothetical protein
VAVELDSKYNLSEKALDFYRRKVKHE